MYGPPVHGSSIRLTKKPMQKVPKGEVAFSKTAFVFSNHFEGIFKMLFEWGVMPLYRLKIPINIANRPIPLYKKLMKGVRAKNDKRPVPKRK